MGSAIRKVTRVLWSMHTLFQEVRTLARRALSSLLLFAVVAALMQFVHLLLPSMSQH